MKRLRIELRTTREVGSALTGKTFALVGHVPNRDHREIGYFS
jgi:hypothetical protein